MSIIIGKGYKRPERRYNDAAKLLQVIRAGKVMYPQPQFRLRIGKPFQA